MLRLLVRTDYTNVGGNSLRTGPISSVDRRTLAGSDPARDWRQAYFLAAAHDRRRNQVRSGFQPAKTPGLRFQLYIASRPELRHVRTKYRSPPTNGVVERWFESVKYEHLFRLEIGSGHVLAEETERYRRLYNEVRPHEHLDFRTPMERLSGGSGAQPIHTGKCPENLTRDTHVRPLPHPTRVAYHG